MSRRERRRNVRRRRTPETDRPDSTGPDYLVVGRIVKPHGVRGELSMKVITEHPERLSQVGTLYIGDDYTPYEVTSTRAHRDNLLVSFENIADREQADTLRSQIVYISIEDAVPLEEGEYYLFQLKGITVVTDDGQTLGTLTDFIETGANDVYEITDEDGKTILIPAIPQVILSVDLDERVMTIHLLEGLLD